MSEEISHVTPAAEALANPVADPQIAPTSPEFIRIEIPPVDPDEIRAAAGLLNDTVTARRRGSSVIGLVNTEGARGTARRASGKGKRG